jgi:signal transduction histidine kinase
MEEVVLEVRDDGVGFAAEGAVPGHLGLQSMQERTVRVGGTLDVENAPARGTRIRARISTAASAARGGAAHLNSVPVSGSPAQQT